MYCILIFYPSSHYFVNASLQFRFRYINKERVGSSDSPRTGLDLSRLVESTALSNSNVPELEENVNTVEPNFSLVGDSYVPELEPINDVSPAQEVPNMEGGKEKTAQYYKNTMRGTERLFVLPIK